MACHTGERRRSHSRGRVLSIKGAGYVVSSLEAALWAFRSTTTFEEGALKVANLGDDADTTSAIYGQLAGGTQTCLTRTCGDR
jgi:ADP-ribosylglycohydrolase